jgi:hypothetical protein
MCRDVVSPAHKKECEADVETLEFFTYVLDSERPDMVVFTGDQINGDSAPNAKSVPSPLKINTDA